MSAPLENTAGDSTPGRLLTVDLNMGTTASPNWAPIQYIESSNFNPDEPVMEDATVYGDGGYSGQDKLGAAWSLGLTLNHMIVPGSNPPAYDATHDYLEQHGVGTFGAANRVQLRIYDFDVNDLAGVVTPRGQAYLGFANYSWPGFGDVAQAASRKVQLSFMGKGKLNKIAHPYPITPFAPVIDSKTPTTVAAAGGTAVVIRGRGFTGTTTVTFAGSAATNFTVLSDSLLVATAPAHAAGSAAVVVTNATGASTTGGTVTYA